MKKITQICPTYPPNIGGVGSYTKILNDHLEAKGIKSEILLSDYLNQNSKKKNLFGKKNKNLTLLLESKKSKNVILHYSGYGYASRGLCFDLVKSLENWKGNKTKRKLIVIFHEIYADGPFYRMSFWTSFLQKYLAKKLYKLSNVSLVTSKQNKFILSSLYNKKKRIIYSNVFSNVGELKKNINLKKRKNKGIIFGNMYQKELLYKDILLNKIKYETLLKKMSIEEIIDIGPKIDIAKKINLDEINLNRVGILPKKKISSFLKNSKVGLVFYPIGQMTKSGIVAAYASHGLVIVNCCQKEIFKTNEFISGVNYVSKISKKHNINFQKICNQSYKNYKKNSLIKTAELIVKNINENLN